MTAYQCPLCASSLDLDGDSKGFSCATGHHFDKAKEGYVHLLPVQHKHSKAPGDNKAMLQARHAFLAAGYYQPLAVAMATMIEHHCHVSSMQVLDLGCGEGYYSRQLALQLPQLQFHGLDIAKVAIAMAAKLQPSAQFAVASTLRLPYPERSFDLVFRVFAPSNAAEIARVLKPGGWLLTVTPGPRHLWQLKELIYPEAREHPTTGGSDAYFSEISTQRCQYTITPAREHRLALLQMTPFAWHASASAQQQLAEAESLSIATDFSLNLLQRPSLA